MSFYKWIILSMVLAVIAACSTIADNNKLAVKNYKAATTVAPMQVPADLNAAKIQTMYPIPAGVAQSTDANVSLIPPGSNFQQYEKKKTSTTIEQSATTVANPTQQQTNTATINNPYTVALSYENTWDKVGQALRAAGFQIMEQDNNLGTYYILDKAGSGGVLKRNTPIYQVHLERSGNNTVISLLDAKSQPVIGTEAERILSAITAKLS